MTVLLVILTFAVLLSIGTIVEKVENRKKNIVPAIGPDHVFAQDGGEHKNEEKKENE